MSETVVNGKVYRLWNQFVEGKKQWIGGVLEDLDMDLSAKTKIKDIVLRPNGEDSAYFEIVGDDFSCGFDVQHGGVFAGFEDPMSVTFTGYAGHQFRIKDKP